MRCLDTNTVQMQVQEGLSYLTRFSLNMHTLLELGKAQSVLVSGFA